jgi:hypothetical protein
MLTFYTETQFRTRLTGRSAAAVLYIIYGAITNASRAMRQYSPYRI